MSDVALSAVEDAAWPARQSWAAVAPRARELLAVTMLVALADATLYEGQGYAGIALWLLLVPILLLIGSPRLRIHRAFWVVAGMLTLLAGRLLWLGCWGAATLGFGLLIGASLSLAGAAPHVPTALRAVLCLPAQGLRGLANYLWRAAWFYRAAPERFGWRLVLPLWAVFAFGTLFVLANPDLLHAFSIATERVAQWLSDLSTSAPRVLFWAMIACLAVGLLRPRLEIEPAQGETHQADLAHPDELSLAPSGRYFELRNLLVAVIALFAVYLTFEFKTLWFQSFPAGFYYAGYAHQGAFWLTVALALATVVLSLVFRGVTLADPRIGRLRKLAWIWSLENFVLAVTVYHRMAIYIRFNGLSPMRMIGLFGISAVVAGFCLVLWKIVWGRGFVWLVRGQMAALFIALFLLSITPIDAIVCGYNARRVLAGDLAPAVQITVHGIDAEGFLTLQPLVNCQDSIIREGVKAMLADEALRGEAAARKNWLGWTGFQAAPRLLADRLREHKADWGEYRDSRRRSAAIAKFRDYAHQWY